MIVNSIAYWIEAVIIADMKTITKIYYICYAFSCYTLNIIARETKRNVICYLLWNYRS